MTSSASPARLLVFFEPLWEQEVFHVLTLLAGTEGRLARARLRSQRPSNLLPAAHCTAMVTVLDSTPPMLRTRLTLSPEGTPSGTKAFTW
jgi:hypothetical protein